MAFATWTSTSFARMEHIRVEATGLAQVPGYHAALDQVAQERRFLAFLQAPPLADSIKFVEWLSAGAGLHLVAITATNDVVGWCDVVRHPHAGFTHAGQLGMGVVAPYRRRGIGRRLVQAALERAAASGIRRVELEVFRSNVGAVRLYESTGFQHEGAKREARILDGVVDDVLIMAWLQSPAIQPGVAAAKRE
jgi:ribosomal protein S18 acetylase RimI-like enzyme